MSTLKINTLSNVAGTQSTAVENAIQGSAKAWVNFNGTGTVAIRRSYNVSSITDNGTGDYTVNFSNSMADANYSWGFGTGVQTAFGGYYVTPYLVSMTSGGFRFKQAASGNSTTGDIVDCSVNIFS